MNNDPYLIQRLFRKPTEGKIANLRFGEIFRLDYMGSAEFEFGAFAQFLREMNSHELDSFTIKMQGVKYFGVCSTDPIYNHSESSIHDMLERLAEGKIRTKESAYFPTSRFTQVDAWAAIDKGIFWSRENLNSSIVTAIANSVKYMDEQREKA